MALLEIKDITKSFGETQVLSGISFNMEKGEVIAVIGSSGSGKTTLLRCINFLEQPDGGTITVNGGSFKNYNPGVTTVDPVNAKTGKITLGAGCTTTSTVDGSDTWYTVSK